ncbi:MAG: hypothetical protein IJ181_03170, partial [Acidaminococcaceae bacterium]|nr:hypothetical protein [Acidaminococcaceae bacterium]
RLSVIFVNGFVTASRRSPPLYKRFARKQSLRLSAYAAPSSHFLAIRKNASAIAQTHLISVSL